MKNLGLVGFKSIYGRYLQAHTDGEIHASNEHRNEEETWILYEVDGAQHEYALLNWRNGKFLSKKPPRCQRADSTVVGPHEKWNLVNGHPYGVENAVAIRAKLDGTFMGTDRPAHDTECRGEVMTRDGGEPPKNSGEWPGWWVLEPAKPPSPGKDFWNTVGGAVEGVANYLEPVALDAILGALLV